MRFDDGWEMPEEWRGTMEPRRGGTPVPPPAATPGAPQLLAELLATADLGTAPDIEFHPELAAEARRFVTGLSRPGAEPSARGAAAAALLLHDDHSELIADAWAERWGVVFAARAVAETAGMTFHPSRRDAALFQRWLSPAAQGPWHWQHPESSQHGHDQNMLIRAARRVRARLVAASETDYAATVEALGGYRDGTLPQRFVASFMVPGRYAWIDDDIAAMPAWYAKHPEPTGLVHTLVALSIDAPDQARRLSTMLRSDDRGLRGAPRGAPPGRARLTHRSVRPGGRGVIPHGRCGRCRTGSRPDRRARTASRLIRAWQAAGTGRRSPTGSGTRRSRCPARSRRARRARRR